jgi:hypothetical protein
VILAGVDVRLELRTVVPGEMASLYDTATYDSPAVYDGGTEHWLDLNPQTLYSNSRAPLNGSMDFHVRCWDETRSLDPSLGLYPSLGQGSLLRLLADGQPVWVSRVGPAGVVFDLGDMTCTITGADNLAAMSGSEVADYHFPVEHAADRAQTIIDLPTPMDIPSDVVGTGQLLGPVAASGDAVSLLAELNRSELGAFCTDPDGTIRYVCRDALPVLPPPRFEFWDTSAGDGTYESLTLTAPPVLNRIIGDRVRDSEAVPSPVTYDDPVSVLKHGPWSDTNTVLQFHDDAQVTEWAELQLARRANPICEPSRAIFRVMDDLDYAERTIAALLAVRTLDPVRFHLTSRPGSPRQYDTLVLGIEHDVTPDVWVVTLDLGTLGIPGLGGYDAAVYDANRYAA